MINFNARVVYIKQAFRVKFIMIVQIQVWSGMFLMFISFYI